MRSMRPQVSIIVPHLETPDLAKLCLRSIRRHTHGIPYEIIVIDNHSKDGASLDYLRRVEGIRLIERTEEVPRNGLGHRQAIDLGVDCARGEFVLAIHTDTIPIADDWLQYHLAAMQDLQVGAVGTDKLVHRTPLQHWAHRLVDWATFWKHLRKHRQLARRPYVRSHCALYRKTLLQTLGLRYMDRIDWNAGLSIHLGLEEAGYRCLLLDPFEVSRRVAHLNHATGIRVQADLIRPARIRRVNSHIESFIRKPNIQEIMHNDSLDLISADERQAQERQAG